MAEAGCSCRGMTTYPLSGHCNMETAVYEAEVTATGLNGQPNMQKYVEGKRRPFSEPTLITTSHLSVSQRDVMPQP